MSHLFAFPLSNETVERRDVFHSDEMIKKERSVLTFESSHLFTGNSKTLVQKS
jgi:hypothetical protein